MKNPSFLFFNEADTENNFYMKNKPSKIPKWEEKQALMLLILKYETKNCDVQSIKDHMEEKKLT